MTNLITSVMEVVYSAVSDSLLTLQDTVIPTHQICMKFYEMVGCNPPTNRLDVFLLSFIAYSAGALLCPRSAASRHE